MEHKTANRRSPAKTISTSEYTVAYSAKTPKKIKKNTFNAILRLINKEEDEDNDQTFWPFTPAGRLSLSRLS